jgi:serine/threonine-protein kinase
LRSDIYSLGATMYHLLTCQLPVDAKERFLHPGALIPIRQINSAISARTERTIFQTLGMHPSERPATVRELRTLLYGSSPPRPTLTTGTSTITPQLPLFSLQLNGQIFRQNSILIGCAAVADDCHCGQSVTPISQPVRKYRAHEFVSRISYL